MRIMFDFHDLENNHNWKQADSEVEVEIIIRINFLMSRQQQDEAFRFFAFSLLLLAENMLTFRLATYTFHLTYLYLCVFIALFAVFFQWSFDSHSIVLLFRCLGVQLFRRLLFLCANSQQLTANRLLIIRIMMAILKFTSTSEFAYLG